MQNAREIEFAKALSEIDFILKHTDENLQRKVPQSFWNYIKENKNEEYKVEIDTIPLESKNLREDTINLMAIVYRNYFCSFDEKKEYDEILNQNEQKYREKYSYDNLFKIQKKEAIEEHKSQSNELTEYKKEKFIIKIINNAKMFLTRLIIK